VKLHPAFIEKMKSFILLLFIYNPVFSQQDTIVIKYSVRDRNTISYYNEENGLVRTENYDENGLLYKKVWKAATNKADSVEYFDTEGNRITISTPFWKIILDYPSFPFKDIENAIRDGFNWKNVAPDEGQGSILLSFTIIDTSFKIMNIRVLSGIHKSLNEEAIRSAQNVNLSKILYNYDDISFPLEIYTFLRFE